MKRAALLVLLSLASELHAQITAPGDCTGAATSPAPSTGGAPTPDTHAAQPPNAAILPSVRRRYDTTATFFKTEFIVDGAIKNALGDTKDQSAPAPATGSLGLTHHTCKVRLDSVQVDAVTGTIVRGSSNVMPLTSGAVWQTRRRISSERLKALITLASNIDTLKGSDRARRAFAGAVLTPGAAGRGNGASGSIDYARLYEYSPVTHQEFGPRIYGSFSKMTWTAVDSSVATPVSHTKDLAILSAGAHVMWIALNHPATETNSNEFSFTMELGYAIRSIAGDAASDTAFKRIALGNKRGLFHGPEAAISIRLKQVTASATLPWLGRFGGEKLEGLTGLQPVVEFNVDAPLVTF